MKKLSPRKLVPREIKRFGWRPDIPDAADRYLSATHIAAVLPPSTDLRSGLPECYDQGNLGSCTANAIAGAIAFDQRKQKQVEFTPSRLFIYYGEREIEHTIAEDAGAMIRDGFKVIAKLGAPSEVQRSKSDPNWPYTIKKFRTKPGPLIYKEALKHQALIYSRVCQDLHQLKGCLANGFPFVYGFAVYESFESAQVAKDGQVPMPKIDKGEQQLGGHAVLCVGYDDARQKFLVRNSWGNEWGMNGYFQMPYEYLLNRDLCDDFWTVSSIE